MKIAIIGTGIAGLGAAYALSRLHEVELFEANGYVGGHANTVTLGSLELDTGFIVHNAENYPSLTRLAYWERPGMTLEEAQRAKIRRVCEKLALGPDDHVLEIGCGWGGFAIQAASSRRSCPGRCCPLSR